MEPIGGPLNKYKQNNKTLNAIVFTLCTNIDMSQLTLKLMVVYGVFIIVFYLRYKYVFWKRRHVAYLITQLVVTSIGICLIN